MITYFLSDLDTREFECFEDFILFNEDQFKLHHKTIQIWLKSTKGSVKKACDLVEYLHRKSIKYKVICRTYVETAGTIICLGSSIKDNRADIKTDFSLDICASDMDYFLTNIFKYHNTSKEKCLNVMRKISDKISTGNKIINFDTAEEIGIIHDEIFNYKPDLFNS